MAVLEINPPAFLISSEDILAQQYSTPNSNTANDFFVAKNFLAYGNKLYVTRVVNQGAVAADYAKTAIMNNANNAQTLVKNEDDYNENYGTGISGVGEFFGRIYLTDKSGHLRTKADICGQKRT